MCVVSAVYDRQTRDWDQYRVTPYVPIEPLSPRVVPDEASIRRFIEQILDARAEDIANDNPDCGLAEKKDRLLDTIEGLEAVFEDLQGVLKELRTVVEDL